MNVKLSLTALLFVAVTTIIPTSLSCQSKDDVLMTVAGKNVTLEEFRRIYNKNRDLTKDVAQDDLDEYLELFINFKLKVAEAEALGMDTLKKFVDELAGYRKQLAQPYLVDTTRLDELVKQAYERSKTDVRASHILVRVSPNAKAEDTLAAYKKIEDAAKRIHSMDDFLLVARQVSEDPSVKDNGGDLGYFSAFQMVYPFENAAYNTPVGKLSKPVRTRFGYHIIWVTDKRPARGQIHVAHIMVKLHKKATPEQKEQAKQKIDEIYKKLNEGGSFEELAKLYSDDKGSAKKGGELPWFGTGRMVASFEDAAFALQKDGDITEPVQTEFGWHIIKRLEWKGIAPFDQMEKDLRAKVQHDARGQQSTKSLVSKLKKQYGYTDNSKGRYSFYKVIGDDYFTGKWDESKVKKLNADLFTLKDNSWSHKSSTYTQQDFASYLRKQMKHQPKQDVRQFVDKQYNQWVASTVLDFEQSILEYKYPKFAHLMEEYRDGILLFDLMDKKVWSRAVSDTTGLEKYYADHKGDFMWDQRVDAEIFVCKDEATAKAVRKLVKKREKKGYSNEDIMNMTNTDSPLNLQIESGIYSKGDQPILDQVMWSEGMSDNVSWKSKVAFASVNKVIPPQPKSLHEARGLVTAAYQSYLEKQWIDELRAKYSVKVNKEVLKHLQ